MQRRVLIIILFTIPLITSAQGFFGSVDFDFLLDNREYRQLEGDPPSQTLFGSSISPMAGYRWDALHSINAGFNFFKDFGTYESDFRLTPYIYYNYKNPNFNFDVGIVPREKLSDRYNRIFFSDSIRFHDVDVEGLIIQYKKANFSAETVLDWTAKRYDYQRERFMIFGFFSYDYKEFYTGLTYNYYHFAGSHLVKGVVDSYLFNPHIGYRKRDFFFDSMDISAGWVQLIQRERVLIKEYVERGGFFIDVTLKKFSLGLNNTFFAGKDMMPYYYTLDQGGAMFGNELYLGERFFGTHKGVYDRLELFWRPKVHECIDLNFSFVLHFDGRGVGTKQIISLKIDLDQLKFKKR